ncbi:WecB/TagA/CpsF family glycosyltransferase [Gordonia rhizosphera]|nr:WecB/TagA/CpsF family glycosyltransferase [Gordonia rhizosphera]
MTDLQSAAKSILEKCGTTPGYPIRLINAYSISCAVRDPEYMAAMAGYGQNYADGLPLACYLSWTADGRPRANLRVRGPSLFEAVLEASQGTGISHFFLGGSPRTLNKLEQKIKQQYPNILAAGYYSPGISELDDGFIEECLEAVRPHPADIVWVGLGTPKQDFISAILSERVGATCIGIGAAFDFVAETTPQAPKVIQASGFEWAYRLATEPRRLWRRYTFGSFYFLSFVARDLAARFRVAETNVNSAHGNKTKT